MLNIYLSFIFSINDSIIKTHYFKDMNILQSRHSYCAGLLIVLAAVKQITNSYLKQYKISFSIY